MLYQKYLIKNLIFYSPSDFNNLDSQVIDKISSITRDF